MHDEYIAETFEHNGYTIKIIQDEDASNPRKEFDHAATMACWHRRYDLGDEQPSGSPSDWLDSLAEEYRPGFVDYWDNTMYQRIVHGNVRIAETADKRGEIWRERRTQALWRILDAHYVMLPLGLIDHSGISMYVGSGAHSCDPGGWDSGQVGWAYIDRKKAIKEWGGKSGRFTKRVRKQARECIEAEVEEYDQYLTGDVWGFVIETPDGKDVDSCWGHFGLEWCKQAAIEACPDEPAAKGGESEDEAHDETLVG